MNDVRYTSEQAHGLSADLLARFLRYVQIDTQARRDRERSPSSPGQLELGRLLAEELSQLGLADVVQDGNGYVTATLPGVGPTVGLIAHLDTSPDAPGAGVAPIVHERYGGEVIELPRGGIRLDPATMPELLGKVGHDLVTAGGDTLLGADDKAGVAIIMAALAQLSANPQLPRTRLRICFTPDEEIGEGATLFDIPGFGAHCAYTIDGSELGELQDETFSAQEAIVTVEGVDVHPGQATGKLVNALRLAAEIISGLPAELTPERTAERQGFIHVYELRGSAAKAQIRAIVRDFDDRRLGEHVELLEHTAQQAAVREPRARVLVEVRTQYRNMRRHLDQVPHVLGAAEAAMRAEGIEPIRAPIRGGTDGSRLSEMGLPTPNIFTGGHEYHSVREWASVQDMAAAASTVVRLAGEWAKPGMGTAGEGAGGGVDGGPRAR